MSVTSRETNVVRYERSHQKTVCYERSLHKGLTRYKMSISLFHISLLIFGAFWLGVIFSQFAINRTVSFVPICDTPGCLDNITSNLDDTLQDEEVVSKTGSKFITRVETEDQPENTKSKTLILLHGDHWTKYDKWQRFDWRKCPPKWSTCRITTDKSRLFESSAVVFNSADMPIPKEVNRIKAVDSITKVFLSGLTPLRTKFDPSDFQDFFDASITYKTESDIRIPYWPNDGLLPAMYRAKAQGKILTGEETLDLQDDIKGYFTKFGKDFFMGYTIKNCDAKWYPNLFVGKLREEGLINTYSVNDSSECLSRIKETVALPCKGVSTDDCSKHFERFKFIITADEDLCVDYTTRDYWNAIFAWQTVPLLYGASNYTKHLIPNSYIDMVADEDYISPSFKKAYGPSQDELTYYKSFHMWKHEDRLEEYHWQCELCEMLKKKPIKKKIDMEKFWNVQADCGSKLPVHEHMRLQLVRTGVIR